MQLSDLTQNFRLVIFMAILAGCQNMGEAPVESGAKNEGAVSYRHISKSYVETVRFVIRENEDIEFHGHLLDPFSTNKLEVHLRGKPTMTKHGWHYLETSEMPPHRIRFSYRYNDANQVELLIVVESEAKTPYTGQWPAVCEPN